jgi:hypothetical protein
MNTSPHEELLRAKAKDALRKLYDRDERAGKTVISPLTLAQRVCYEVFDPGEIAPLPIQGLAIRQLERWAREVCAERNRARRKGNRVTGGSQ